MRIKWWKAAGIRAVKTVAQTAIATIGTGALLSDVNWLAVASSSALAGMLSLLTSVAGLPEVSESTTWTSSAAWRLISERLHKGH